MVTLSTSPHKDMALLKRCTLRCTLGRLAVFLALGLSPAAVRAQVSESAVQTTEGNVMVTPGAKGAQMYCYLRANGNSYQVSWNAAYALVKRQKDSPFKTSEEHASVMISEAVVQNPAKFPDCGRYLGDLFTKGEAKTESPTETKAGSGSGATNRK
ncbi:DUF6554 family protein [Cyanobium sp. WAJ14-Wanaka]|uniref:DUF6554 family protein n=1 Tax=Cyanobium sp. WAJ14-Wanaka TaxID=2823725 RepID=UPI0020CD8835|nr:DUF6554 family protein [Cyanobium sp. WAJ14-Wanaka]MCP9775585.1 penicillin amidase [Cyanobium sp. WAJ14-Wanaka]